MWKKQKLFWPLLSALIILALLTSNYLLRARDVSQLQVRYGAFYWNSNIPWGVAFSGTNYLFAARATNGALSAVRMTPDGPMTHFDLGRTGGVPRVAFDGTNFLMVWPDLAAPPADIQGQFISPNGSMVGGPFLIEADADAAEAGGLAFDGTDYLAVWEANGAGSNGVPTVHGRLISRAGTLIGGRLQISEGSTAQKFPAVACNSNHFLVSWVGRSDTTNLWHALGRRISRDGSLRDIVTISQVPAQQPWSVAVASDGTNWLTAWTRETGPYEVYWTNAPTLVPSLFGRIVESDGNPTGSEFEVRRGGLGQFMPTALFDGKSYVLAWLEKRVANWPWPSPPVFGQRVYVVQLDKAGEQVLPGWNVGIFVHNNTRSLVLGPGDERVICAWESIQVAQTAGIMLLRLTNESPVLRNLRVLPGGEVQLDLVSSTATLVEIQSSTDLVNWSAAPMLPHMHYSMYSPGSATMAALPPGSGNRRFFRSINGQADCIANLRLIHQAKERWALERNRSYSDIPVHTDLFGPGKYLLDAPVCPNGGTYYFEAVQYGTVCNKGATLGHTM